MNRNLTRCLFALLLAVASGCSSEPEQLTSPARVPGIAPFVAAPRGAKVVPGSYIVVFRDGLFLPREVDPVVDQLARQHGFSARFRYRRTLRGFAATMSEAVVARLRSDPRVAYIEQNQVVSAF